MSLEYTLGWTRDGLIWRPNGRMPEGRDFGTWAQRYEAGETTETLAAEARVHPTTMRTWISNGGGVLRTERVRGADEADLAKYARQYATGRSIREVAKAAHVSKDTMRRWLVEAGAEIRPALTYRPPGAGRKAHGSKADIARWVDLYKEGQSLMGIGKQAGVSGNTIRRWLIEAKVPLREGHQSHTLGLRIAKRAEAKGRLPEWIALYQAGRSLKAISNLAGVSHVTIRRWLLEAGVEPRDYTGKPKSEEAA